MNYLFISRHGFILCEVITPFCAECPPSVIQIPGSCLTDFAEDSNIPFKNYFTWAVGIMFTACDNTFNCYEHTNPSLPRSNAMHSATVELITSVYTSANFCIKNFCTYTHYLLWYISFTYSVEKNIKGGGG